MAVAIFGIGGLGVVAVALSWGFARWWCSPRRRPATATPADRGLPFEPVEFSSEGDPVRGWFVPARSERPRPPVVVLAHGWSGSASDLLAMAGALRDGGLAVLAYDARGHGGSGGAGPVTILHLARDVLAAVAHVRARPDVDAGRVGVLGFSIGGGAVILAASADPRVKAVVSCSAFADPEELTREVMRRMHLPERLLGGLAVRFIERWLGTTMTEVAPRNRISLVAAPVLLVHGEEDRFLPASHMEALFARASPQRTRRLLVPRRGHANLLEDARCRHEIVSFLSERLSGAPEAPGGLEAGLDAACRSLLPRLGACC